MDYYLGEIRMFGGIFAPQDFLQCNGSILDIQQYTALYSLMGVVYGGNGTSNFGIPDLRGRVPMGQGTGTNLTPRAMGASGGTETVSLAVGNIPAHSHTMVASSAPANSQNPNNAFLGTVQAGMGQFVPNSTAAGAALRPMSANVVGYTGSGVAHNNMMPSLPITYMICVQGLYPSRV